MKAVIKSLQVVQTPIMQCLYTVPDIVNLPFGFYVPIEEQVMALDLSSVDLTSDNVQENKGSGEDTDPLLALAGTLNWDDIATPDIAFPPEIQVVKGAQEDNPDPLLALAGTLQADVTDISERHDDYIAAALLAELRGDVDE